MATLRNLNAEMYQNYVDHNYIVMCDSGCEVQRNEVMCLLTRGRLHNPHTVSFSTYIKGHIANQDTWLCPHMHSGIA